MTTKKSQKEPYDRGWNIFQYYSSTIFSIITLYYFLGSQAIGFSGRPKSITLVVFFQYQTKLRKAKEQQKSLWKISLSF